ncbi:DUF4832 domain-containing protein [Larkinella harenae]
MLFSRKIGFAGLAFIGLAALLSRCSSTEKMVVVKPVETDAFLLNPGRGFTSTSTIYNEHLTNRRHTPCGISQQRFFWNALEPEEGKIRFDLIDSTIARAVRNGQQVNFRVMCQDVDMMVPEWALKAGVKSPFYDNPVFIEKQVNLIKALGQRYDGHPDVCFVDIGSVGQWGEWHTDPDAADPKKIVFPSDSAARIIIDAYLGSFTKTPLAALIAFKQKYGFGYAVSKKTGWRADCWGDMDSLGWNHMKGVYPPALQAANAFENWQHGPVALETCWTMEEWHKRGWNIDYILAKALEWHATGVNNGNEAIPEEWYPKVKEFEKKLGYRFVLEEMKYSALVGKGATITCEMIWQNRGVAPIYKSYDLAVQLVAKNDSNKRYRIRTDADVKKWLPGRSAYRTSLPLPDAIAPGDYELQVGLLAPSTGKPAIQLAIAGKTGEGWYKVGDISIAD